MKWFRKLTLEIKRELELGIGFVTLALISILGVAPDHHTDPRNSHIFFVELAHAGSL